MDTWLHVVIQQITLYLLPVVISMTMVCWLERRFCQQVIPHPFYSVVWKGTWFPFLASIAFTRAVIVCSARPLAHGLYAAWIRFLSHAFLTLVGFLLYSWSLAHLAPVGLPPIHHWWAKVFMFFNLCMLGMHLLPLPNLWMGEYLMRYQGSIKAVQWYAQWLTETRMLWLMTLLVASPLLDMLLGTWLIYPIYGELTTWAVQMHS